MTRHVSSRLFSATLAIVVLGVAGIVHISSGQQQGPVIVPRPLSNPSIHEGPSGIQRAGYKQVFPTLGQVTAGYSLFGATLQAMGSLFQPFQASRFAPTYKGGQNPGFDFWGAIGFKRNVSRLDPGGKGIGGKNVTDVPQLGKVCGSNPGDPYWVAFPRPGHIENPVAYETLYDPWDCFCRCDEDIECPVPGPYRHSRFGGTNPNRVNCRTCFGDQRIRKHDKFVGTSKGSHPGYDLNRGDSGYQECLRQSIESYAGSGPGGGPTGKELYGL